MNRYAFNLENRRRRTTEEFSGIAQAMLAPARFLTTDAFLANYSDIVEVVDEETDPQYQRYGAFSGTAR